MLLKITNKNQIRQKANYLLKKHQLLLHLANWAENNLKFFFNRFFNHDFKSGKIKELEIKLYSFGFTESALKDLAANAKSGTDLQSKIEATWHLALWHVGQREPASAKRALSYLAMCRRRAKNAKWLCRIAIVEAECHEILGNITLAKQIITQALKIQPQNTDLMLAAANLEKALPEKLAWINRALKLQGLATITTNPVSKNLPMYDLLNGLHDWPDSETNKTIDGRPKVSVIVPAYNAESTIKTTLDSLINQTWGNLEILVADDCSTDHTPAIVDTYTHQDSRVRLLCTPENSGPYVARNIALKNATGVFVTCNDADDWSHPQKIEKQVLHLINNPSTIGNTSQLSRATNKLKFHRRINHDFYLHRNLSSFMFRRKPVLKSVGYWDNVRFGADDEFIRRIKKIFGETKVVDLPSSLLSFSRQTKDSLVSNSAFGFHGCFMGARKEYLEQQLYFHKNNKKLYYGFPEDNRPFPVPDPMLPTRKTTPFHKQRHYDVIIAAEFRLPGKMIEFIIQEINSHKRLGQRTGLVQLYSYDAVDANRAINEKVRTIIDGTQVQMIVYGEKIACDLLIVRYPPVLQHYQHFVPMITARSACIIIDSMPFLDYDRSDTRRYDFSTCQKNVKRYFGLNGTWYPIDPTLRRALNEHHKDELFLIKFSDEDWQDTFGTNKLRKVFRSEMKHLQC